MRVLTEEQKQKRLNDLAREIIEKNQYVSIATSDQFGVPWISPVCYAHDKKWNLYFVSKTDSKHIKNINIKKEVACCIFDSRQLWGKGVGLQIEAEIAEPSFKDTLKAGKCYISRKYPFPNSDPRVVYDFIQNFLANRKIYRFYKITPLTVWINDPYSEVDRRVKIDLKK